jgi:hypothetical protein
MAGWRDIKAKALAKVHDTFECPAVYLPAGNAFVATRVDVRIHSKVGSIENEFIWPGASPVTEIQPKIVFRRDQMPMTRANALVVVSAGEIYRLGPAEPDRAGYFKVECVRLTADECQVAVAQLGPVSGATWEGILP